jgi:hypothetical protein
MGSDLNVSIGTRASSNDSYPEEEGGENENLSPIETLIGPCGNPRTNKKGDHYRNLMLQLDLRSVSTFYCNNKGYDIWRNPATDEKYQLDHFLVPCYHSKLTKDVKKKHYRVPSDHWALALKMMKRKKVQKRISE